MMWYQQIERGFYLNSSITGNIVVDDGGSNTVCITKHRVEIFPSVKGIYGNRTLTQVKSKYDFIVEYNNECYVMGSLAAVDCDFPLQMFSKSKQHEFFDLSVLVSIHQYGFYDNRLIISVPVRMHTKEEKQGRINRLLGNHTLKVNGITKSFLISDVKISAESTTAYFINQPLDESHYIDIGSRTVNFSKILNTNGDFRLIDTASGTFFDKGLESLGDAFNAKALADYICGQLLAKWNPNAKVFLLGGGALNEDLVNRIKTYFPNSEVMSNPLTANAEGMFILAGMAYGMD